MLSRALSLATVTLLVGCLTAAAVRAVENLEAGKSPAQIFAGTCNACHKSPRGLLRSVPASSLPSFLRQHYTTSSDMASVLSSYLVSNGATDTRQQGKDAKQGKDGAKEGTKEAARAPADQPGAKQQSRLPRPGETSDTTRPDGAVQAAVDPKQKQKQGKKGRQEELPRTEPADAPKDTAKGDEKPAADPGKTEPSKTESAKVEPKDNASDSGSTRADPVPAVTPAPSSTAAVAPTATPSATQAAPGPAPGASTVPVAPLDSPAIVLPELPKAPAVAAAPALPPVPPAGPPMVPISQ